MRANDTVSVAISLYCLGPALKQTEPEIPDTYYISCGNALIALWAYARGLQCSFSNQFRYFAWMTACNLKSFVHEIDRTSEVRGQFGQSIVPAFAISLTPFLIFVIPIGVLNYIIMGKIMRKAAEGKSPMLYHRCEVACDIAAAGINIIYELEFGVLADWLKYAFTGKATCRLVVTLLYHL